MPAAINKWQNEITIPNHADFWTNTFKLAFLVGHDSWGKILHHILATDKNQHSMELRTQTNETFVVQNQKAYYIYFVNVIFLHVFGMRW